MFSLLPRRQRGSNENTNRLLRFWLEKGTDLSTHTAEDLARIAATLNKRPRPTRDLRTPAHALAELLSNPAAAWSCQNQLSSFIAFTDIDGLR